MEHSARHVHVLAPSVVLEHAHAETANPSSGLPASHDPEQKSCCDNILLVAFYTAGDVSKIFRLASAAIHPQVQLSLTLFVSELSLPTGQEQPNRFRAFPPAAHIPPPSLYRLRTSLLV